MLRPNDFLDYFKARAKLGLSDFNQLIEGLSIGGMIVVGGGKKNVQRVLPVMSNLNRLGSVSSIEEITQIDVRKTMTLDAAAVAQLIMIAKNETFFQTLEQCVKTVEDVIADDHSIEVALDILRQQAAKIQRL